MSLSSIFLVLVFNCWFWVTVNGFRMHPGFFQPLIHRVQRFSTSMNGAIPMELEGKLSPDKSWDVTFIFNGQEKTVNVPETESILNSGNKIFDDEVPFSCLNGVCITCACQV